MQRAECGLLVLCAVGVALLSVTSIVSAEPSESGDTSAVRVVRDVAYEAVDGVEPTLLSLDVYVPTATGDGASDSGRPVVFYVH